jgi:mannose-6-phosphate isomerase-like protein (cupin superfamily)
MGTAADAPCLHRPYVAVKADQEAKMSNETGGASTVEGFALKRIDDMQAIHHGAVKLAAAELGVESFGVQVLDFPPGFADYPEHDHADDGQEEVYVVLAGSAQFTIDERSVALDGSQMLRIAPGTRRKLVSGPQGVRVLAVGRTVGGGYRRPAEFELEPRR